MRVVVDTSVLVSALLSTSGPPAQVLAAAATRSIEIVTCPRALEELSDTLMREKFRRWVDEPTAKEFVTAFAHLADLCQDVEPQTSHTRDPNDDYLVALAHAQNARIVSGDRDILEAQLDPPALTPRKFLELL